MNYGIALLFGGLGLAIVLMVIPVILRVWRGSRLLHRPIEPHHTHKTPVPRLGGLALAVAFLAVEGLAIIVRPEKDLGMRLTVILSSLAIFLVGFWDDLRPLGAKRKLLAQVLVASAVYGAGYGINGIVLPAFDFKLSFHGWGYLLTVLWLVGMTNLINLIDGVDGLAGGICLMLMVLLSFVGYSSGSFELLAYGMTGALLGFLLFNFPPARIYLGDGGAYFLGFQIGLVSLLSSHKGTVTAALIAPLFVLALPIIDTAIAIVRRGLKGLPVFRADREHLHHHLLRTGMSRSKVVLGLYAVTLLFLAMGFAVFVSNGRLVPSLLGASVLLLLVCAGNFKFSREWFAVGRVVGNSLGMRQEVKYALTISRWLEMEGLRARSTEALWRDLAFAAGKLGFTSLKLRLPDGERQFGEPSNAEERPAPWVKKVNVGDCGQLELLGGPCRQEENLPKRCDRDCPCIRDGQLFEILSDLLVESWVKAARRMMERNGGTLAFHPLSKDSEVGIVPALRSGLKAAASRQLSVNR